MEVSGQLLAPATVHTGKSPDILWTVNRRLDGPQSQPGRFGEEKKLLSLPRFEPRIVQTVS